MDKKRQKRIISTLSYLSILFWGVLTTTISLRFGKTAFSIEWIVGSFLITSWGSLFYAFIAPTLPNYLWTISFREGIWRSMSTFFWAMFPITTVYLFLPAFYEFLQHTAHMPVIWIYVFLCIGIFKNLCQGLSTLIFREHKHGFLIKIQTVGRILEIAAVLWAIYSQSKIMYGLANCFYPLVQLLSVAFIGLRRQYDRNIAQVLPRSPGTHTMNMLSMGLDLVIQTIWFRLAGQVIYVSYRAITAAIGYAVIIPRYWYSVEGLTLKRGKPSLKLKSLSLLIALVLAGGYQILTGIPASKVILLSFIPLGVNVVLGVWQSQQRQLYINQQNILVPALASIAGRLSEIVLLLLLSVIFTPQNPIIVLAYTGYAVSSIIYKISENNKNTLVESSNL